MQRRHVFLGFHTVRRALCSGGRGIGISFSIVVAQMIHTNSCSIDLLTF